MSIRQGHGFGPLRSGETGIKRLHGNGIVDAQTPVAALADAAGAFDGPHHHVVFIPHATHGVLSGSGPVSATGPRSCGSALVTGFLRDPAARLEDDCVATHRPPDPRGVEGLASSIHGVADLWENDAGAAGAEPVPEWLQDELSRVLGGLDG